MFLFLLINFHGLFEWLDFVDGLHLYFYLFVKKTQVGGQHVCMQNIFMLFFGSYVTLVTHYFCFSCQSGWQCFPPHGETANVGSHPSSNMSPFWNQSTMWRPFPWQPFFNDNFAGKCADTKFRCFWKNKIKSSMVQFWLHNEFFQIGCFFPTVTRHVKLYISPTSQVASLTVKPVLFVSSEPSLPHGTDSCCAPEGFRATGRCGRKLQILVLATQRRSLTQFQGRRVDLQFLTDNSRKNKVDPKREDPDYTFELLETRRNFGDMNCRE